MLHPLVRRMARIYIPEKNISPWLQDKEAFEGQSPLDYLSELERGAFEEKKQKLYVALLPSAFLSVEDFPSYEEFLNEVRDFQYKELKLI